MSVGVVMSRGASSFRIPDRTTVTEVVTHAGQGGNPAWLAATLDWFMLTSESVRKAMFRMDSDNTALYYGWSRIRHATRDLLARGDGAVIAVGGGLLQGEHD